MASEHQDYVQHKLNPVLESLVMQLLVERPEHIANFMIEWLRNRTTPSQSEESAEMSTLKAELNALKEEVGRLEQGIDEDTTDLVEEDEEEDASDDEVDEVVAAPAKSLLKERTSVSAEAYGTWNKKQVFVPPVYEKSVEHGEQIKEMLLESFMFANLDDRDLHTVISAMVVQRIDVGTQIIKEGDDGDSLYFVESGQINCFKKVDGEEQLVKECKAGEIFGELALLYHCPRAASCIAAVDSVVFSLDRTTFNHIVREAAVRRWDVYGDFVKQVPIFKTLDEYALSRICDVLRKETHKKDEVITEQGDIGDKFYIVEEGQCVVKKAYIDGVAPRIVKEYRSGDYFGELALLHNEPRAATVIAASDCTVLVISRRSFKAMLGSLEDILKSNAAAY